MVSKQFPGCSPPLPCPESFSSWAWLVITQPQVLCLLFWHFTAFSLDFVLIARPCCRRGCGGICSHSSPHRKGSGHRNYWAHLPGAKLNVSPGSVSAQSRAEFGPLSEGWLGLCSGRSSDLPISLIACLWGITQTWTSLVGRSSYSGLLHAFPLSANGLVGHLGRVKAWTSWTLASIHPSTSVCPVPSLIQPMLLSQPWGLSSGALMWGMSAQGHEADRTPQPALQGVAGPELTNPAARVLC